LRSKRPKLATARGNAEFADLGVHHLVDHGFGDAGGDARPEAKGTLQGQVHRTLRDQFSNMYLQYIFDLGQGHRARDSDAGNCGGCPSSRVTLKAGVERIVRRIATQSNRPPSPSSNVIGEDGRS
jgi:hypothetical protein